MKNSYEILPLQLLINSAKHGITSLIFLLVLLVRLPFCSAQPTHHADPSFSPSMGIMIVVLISAFFSMGFFSIYIRHCSDSRGGISSRPLTGAQRSGRAVGRGLNQEVLKTFPTLVYSEVKQLKIGKGMLECAVCLNEFEDDEMLRLIPKCDHVFHPECIDAWLGSHTTCPVCRANLVPQPGEPRTELDVGAQNDVAAGEEPQQHMSGNEETQPPEPQVINVNGANQTPNRNRTRRSRSICPRKFPRSHSTGHSLVEARENTERFTLRLPVEVRQQIMNLDLNRSHSLPVFPRQSSLRRGYSTRGEDNNRGRNSRWLDQFGSFKIFSRASSLRSPRITAIDVTETWVQPAISSTESNPLPV